MKRSKGFTLIELLAVIVILAIIALIATPMILKYIDNAKEGSNDISAESILRAADNYYAASLLDKNMTYPKEFDLSNKEDMATLGLKGDMPDEGILEIYSDGTTFIEAMYDDVIYVKLPNETKVSKNPKVIGDPLLWEVENGVIKAYISPNNIELKQQRAINDTNQFGNYVQLALLYAGGDRSSTNTGIDFSKSLAENATILEESGYLSRSSLPLELNKEIDVLLTIYNTEQQLDMTEVQTIGTTNIDKLSHALDYYNNTEPLTTNVTEDEIVKTTAYQLIYDSYETGSESNVVVVPNYVKKSDGTLEKITAIGTGPIYVSDFKMGKDLIISYGIESIGNLAFYIQGLNSVVIPSSVKTIGEASFGYNAIKSVKLPYNLETIGKEAFKHNQLEGELVIPKNVTTIGNSAFTAERWTFTDQNCSDFANLGYNLCDIRYKNNVIEKVTFESGSKINTIEADAFNGNLLTTITIPGSIVSIGSNAFNMSTLTSATIQKAKGNDLVVATGAFGSVTPTYQS